jgi:GH25 family lysozyme M1 (1,4-beta-N-acetylmuramidase)
MPTTTANITISSDIMSYPISISKSMVLKKFQSGDAIEETSGLRVRKFNSTTATEIVDHTDFPDDKAHKLYIRNTGSSKAQSFIISYHASAAGATTAATIGRLYGGDWMLMPYDGNVDINVASSTAETMTLEYMVFAEDFESAKG